MSGMSRKKKTRVKKKTKWPLLMVLDIHAKGQARTRAFAIRRWNKKRGKKLWTASVRKLDSEAKRERGIGGMMLAHCIANGVTRPLEGPVLVEVAVIFEKPKSHLRAGNTDTWLRAIHTSKPDADNILKAIKDAGNGIVWKDDSQVVPIGPIKLYGARTWDGHVFERDCIAIKIRPVTYDFLEKRINRLLGPDPLRKGRR